ncbi:hypothetical protein LCGC14_0393000 [marine sediment metagenome]|uniref:Uncharacterized protein n=1 Tax=marine sediment metagenome TaxID=412755 RepID=A0A0F9T4U3_9ZZZZ
MITVLEIHEYMPEMAAFVYFRWLFNKWEISIYRTHHRHRLYFRLDLPFVHLNNTVVERPVKDDSTDLGWKVMPVTMGKVFGKTVKS